MKKVIFILILILGFLGYSQTVIPAFPEAYTIKPTVYTSGITGGRGGTVLHVTNLKDPATCTTYKDYDAGTTVTLANIAGDGLPDIWKTSRGLNLNTSYGLYDFDLSVDVDGDGVNDNNADICAHEVEGILRVQTDNKDEINFVTDTNSPNYVGSLRWALRQTYTRTIVFDVSGAIELHGWIGLGAVHDNYTVAGQTAPEGGITITGNAIIIGGGYTGDLPNVQQCNNYIYRYIRFRNGHYNNRSDRSRDNGIIPNSSTNWILDHCSFSFCNDQGIAAESKGGDLLNGVIQRSIVSECGTGAILGNAQFSTWESGDMASVKNLWVDVDHRAPNIGGNYSEIGLQYDLLNNVHFNYNTFATNIKHPGNPNLNHTGNYIQNGSSSLSYNYTATGSVDYYYIGVADNTTNTQIFSQNNYHAVMNPYDTGDNSGQWRQSGTVNGSFVTLPSSFFVSTPFPLLDQSYTLLTPSATYTDVMADVGANKYLNADGTYGVYKDDFDSDKITKTLNNGPSAYADTEQPSTWASRLPTILANTPKNIRPAGYDTDGDGIPDTLEDATTGLDKTDGADGALIHTSGYSNLEYYYLNAVDGTYTPSDTPVITLTGNSTVNLNLNDSYVDAGATATDLTDGDITANIAVTGTVDTSVVGTYYLYFNVSDSQSNAATQKVRTIIVTDPSDTEAPTPPTSVVFTNVTSTSFTASWSGATDNIGVVSYPAEIDNSSIGTVVGTFYNATSLSPNTTYDFTVFARDAAGNTSAESAVFQVTTLAASVSTQTKKRGVTQRLIQTTF